MAAHQNRWPLTQTVRECGAELAAGDQEIAAGAGEVADFENRRPLCAQESAHMTDRLQFRARDDAERDDGTRMAVHHRRHILPFAVDLAVNEPLEIWRRAARDDWIAVEVEFQHVLFRDQRRRHAAGQQEPIGPFRMPRADMPETVHHALVEQDMVGIDQFADGGCNGLGYGHSGISLLSSWAWMK